tara:strand:+ start:176 stop:580 length:405 start_codon:yes stop_codon:yes gene_type:complete
MKKLLGIIVLGLLLQGCTSHISYWEHYQNCSATEKTIKSISSCGKQSRLNFLKGKEGSPSGNEYMMWVELLGERVENGEMSEAEAKMKLLERNQMLTSEKRNRELDAVSSWAKSMRESTKTTTCTILDNTAFCN